MWRHFVQTNAEHEEKVGLASVDDGVRDHAVPMCLRGFDENGMFGSQGAGNDRIACVSAWVVCVYFTSFCICT